MLLEISISTKKVMAILALVVAGFVVIGLGIVLSRWVWEITRSNVVPFNLNREANIPTWYSSLSLLVCALLLGLIGTLTRKGKQRFAWHWLILSLIFIYLSLDEAASLHEQVIDPLRALVPLSGIFRFAWIIPAGFLILILILFYLRFFWSLPVRTRIYFLVAALFYIGGAMGVEMIQGWLASQYPGFSTLQLGGLEHSWHAQLLRDSEFAYEFTAVIEESMEMIGVLIFIGALLGYIRRQWPMVTLRFAS